MGVRLRSGAPSGLCPSKDPRTNEVPRRSPDVRRRELFAGDCRRLIGIASTGDQRQAARVTIASVNDSPGHFLTGSTHLRLPHFLEQLACLEPAAPPNDWHRSKHWLYVSLHIGAACAEPPAIGEDAETNINPRADDRRRARDSFQGIQFSAYSWVWVCSLSVLSFRNQLITQLLITQFKRRIAIGLSNRFWA